MTTSAKPRNIPPGRRTMLVMSKHRALVLYDNPLRLVRTLIPNVKKKRKALPTA